MIFVPRKIASTLQLELEECSLGARGQMIHVEGESLDCRRDDQVP